MRGRALLRWALVRLVLGRVVPHQWGQWLTELTLILVTLNWRVVLVVFLRPPSLSILQARALDNSLHTLELTSGSLVTSWSRERRDHPRSPPLLVSRRLHSLRLATVVNSPPLGVLVVTVLVESRYPAEVISTSEDRVLWTLGRWWRGSSLISWRRSSLPSSRPWGGFPASGVVSTPVSSVVRGTITLETTSSSSTLIPRGPVPIVPPPW